MACAPELGEEGVSWGAHVLGCWGAWAGGGMSWVLGCFGAGCPRVLGGPYPGVSRGAGVLVSVGFRTPPFCLPLAAPAPDPPGRAQGAARGLRLESPVERGSLMDTSEPGSAAEEEEEKASEQRPRTRSNPEGAEDRALSAQASVGSRSEGEGEAASADDSPQGPAAPSAKAWQVPAPPVEFQVKTPRVNCPEKVVSAGRPGPGSRSGGGLIRPFGAAGTIPKAPGAGGGDGLTLPLSLLQIICLDLSEEMSLPKLESFNG